MIIEVKMAEIEDLEKRLEWLDSERQKEKKNLKELQDTLQTLQELVHDQAAAIKKMEVASKASSTLGGRIDSLKEESASFQTGLLKKLADLEKAVSAGDKKNEKTRKEEMDALASRLEEFQTELKPVSDLKKAVQVRVEEEFRISQKVESVSKEVGELRTTDEEIGRQLSLILSERSQETKRTTDLQLENAALKKRLEEVWNFNDLNKEALSKLDKKFNDLLASEKERKQAQAAFLEKSSLDQVERNNQWKTWQQKNEELQALGNAISTKLLDFDEASRSIRKSQTEFDEVNDRINRRINEITEMNRLSEERFRQEWIAFKAEDQKRWTNYTLTREEESREDARLLNQVNERLTKLEDNMQDMQDSLGQLTEELKKLLNGLYGTSQEMLESFNQAFRKRF
jgi:chromosome segregation ATPase